VHPFVRVRRIVPYPWLAHLQGAGPGQDSTRGLVTVAHDQALALVVTAVQMLLEKNVHFGFDRLLEHLLSTLADHLVEQGTPIEVLAEFGNLTIAVAHLWILKVECDTLVHGVSFQPSLGPLRSCLTTAGYATFFLSERV
jgi:hypothetical protein